jgi:dTDP-glucose 4,6-dehydratase
MVKLLFTGGTGFFGKAVLRYLLAQRRKHSDSDSASTSTLMPAEVVVLSRTPDRFLARHPEFAHLDWLRFHRGDIGEASSFPNDESFTHILHAAADSTDASNLTPLQRYDQIVAGTRNGLQCAIAVGAKRFLLTSSGCVYGPQPQDLPNIPETYRGMPDSLNPDDVYGMAKRQAEHLCALYRSQYGLETVIARCFAFVGPDLPLGAHFAIGNFIRDALHEEAITVAGDGSPLRTYLYQDDLAEWLLTLLDRGKAGEAYNVGSGTVVSIAELARLVRDILAPHKEVRIAGSRHNDHKRNRYIPDIGKAQQELGLQVKIPLAESIQRTGSLLSRN